MWQTLILTNKTRCSELCIAQSIFKHNAIAGHCASFGYARNHQMFEMGITLLVIQLIERQLITEFSLRV